MKNSLASLLTTYSYITKEPIFDGIFKKIDDKDKKELEKVYELFGKFNKHITMEDIQYIVSKLETNAFIIDTALEDKDIELAFHIRALNEETIKLLNELSVMLDRKKILHEV